MAAPKKKSYPKTYLTDTVIERLNRPAKGRLSISDVETGLFLWVTPTGTKSWAVVTNQQGSDRKQRKVIGQWPGLGVAEARAAARELLAAARKGVALKEKVADEQAAAERAAADHEAGSFRAVAESYVAEMRRGQLVGGRKRAVTATTATARERLLEQRVLPTLGDRLLSEITTPMVARLLTQLDKAGGPVDETLKAIRGVFKFALSRGLFNGALPTTGMTSRQPAKKLTRALTDSELAAIWQAAGTQGAFGSVIRLLLLTGQRKNEIAGLTWAEVDLDRKLLVLPAERVKNRKGAHEVALSDPAIQLLAAAAAAYDALHAPVAGAKPVPRKGLVFPSETGTTPISGWNKLKSALDRRVKGNLAGLSDEDHRAIRAGGALRADTVARKTAALARVAEIDAEPWRIHDLRHTFITRCRDGEENAEGEIVWSAPLDVLQAAVNHEITAGVTAAYDHGDLQRRYRLRKRELMDWWARKLMVIVGEAEPRGLAANPPSNAATPTGAALCEIQ